MLLKHIGWAAVIAACVLIADRGAAEQSGKSDDQLVEEALHPTTHFLGDTAFQELTRRRHAEIRKLIAVAGDKDGPSLSRYFAVRLLGLYRDRRSIRVLVKNLDWKCPDDFIVDEVSPFAGSTCAAALAQFGTECAVPILHDLARTQEKDVNDDMLRLRMDLLKAAYPNRIEPWGRDDVVGVVERYIERIPADWVTARRNVGRLLEELKAKPEAP